MGRAMHRSLGILLTAEENPGKLQVGNRLIKSVRSIIASTEVPYFQMTSIGSHITSGKEDENGLDR